MTGGRVCLSGFCLHVRGRQPNPKPSLAHIKHGKNTQNQEGATQVDDVTPRGARHLENAGLHLRKPGQFKSHGRRVVERVTQTEHHLGHEVLRFFIPRQRRKAGVLARLSDQLEQHAIEYAHQHFAGAVALFLRYVDFHEV